MNSGRREKQAAAKQAEKMIKVRMQPKRGYSRSAGERGYDTDRYVF